MLEIINKTDCCGCEVCSNICPKKCITMVQDDWGFYYPKIAKNDCIDCGQCELVCPFKQKYICKRLKAYVVQSKDRTILEKSAAGGAFTTLSKCILGNGGVSVGATYKNKIIMHTIVENISEVTAHSSSKYVQSRMFNTYEEVKKKLDDGVFVLFSGTPCQVNALKNYLGKDYDNLYLVDLVCAGVSSPGVFNEYIYKMENLNGEIKELNFRNKKYGYHSSTMFLLFNKGKKYYRSKLTDYMSNIFNNYIALRPSCTKCKAKGMQRYSDITIFDCWHYSNITSRNDNDLGWSNLIINTRKGKELFDKYKNYFEYYETNADKIISLDGNMYYDSHLPNNNIERFFDDFNNSGLDFAVKNSNSINVFSYFKEMTKPILYKLGLLDIVKKMFMR